MISAIVGFIAGAVFGVFGYPKLKDFIKKCVR